MHNNTIILFVKLAREAQQAERNTEAIQVVSSSLTSGILYIVLCN